LEGEPKVLRGAGSGRSPQRTDLGGDAPRGNRGVWGQQEPKGRSTLRKTKKSKEERDQRLMWGNVCKEKKVLDLANVKQATSNHPKGGSRKTWKKERLERRTATGS